MMLLCTHHCCRLRAGLRISPRRRGGASLVELLVVITLIGVLASLLLPAVQAAREASRRTVCQNQLRQVGLSVLTYADARAGRLPALWKTDHPTPWENFSWRVDVLDGLEEAAVAKRLRLDLPPLDSANLSAVGAQLLVFQCPSTPGFPRHITDFGPFVERPENLVAAACDYAAVFEVATEDSFEPLAGAWQIGAPRAILANQTRSDVITLNMVTPDESSPRRRAVPSSLSAVDDGLSRTVLLAEQAGKPQRFSAARAPREIPDDLSPSMMLGSNLVIAGPHEGAWAMAEMGTFHATVNRDNLAGPYGFHHGAHVAMCDGSVMLLRPEMAWEVLSALLTRDGAEIIDDADWR